MDIFNRQKLCKKESPNENSLELLKFLLIQFNTVFGEVTTNIA